MAAMAGRPTPTAMPAMVSVERSPPPLPFPAPPPAAAGLLVLALVELEPLKLRLPVLVDFAPLFVEELELELLELELEAAEGVCVGQLVPLPHVACTLASLGLFAMQEESVNSHSKLGIVLV
jgi:hypothetical protein